MKRLLSLFLVWLLICSVSMPTSFATLNEVSPARNEYVAGGSTTFPYTFKILDASHLEVLVDGVVSVAYSVTGVGNSSGGNVVFNAAPAVGSQVVILRGTPLSQQTDYIEGSKFPANLTETALDKLTTADQQLSERIDRALKLPKTSTFENLTLPDPVSGKIIQWKSDLSGFDNVSLPTTSTPLAQLTQGTESTRLALSPVEGQLFQQTDKQTGIWQYLNGAWVHVDNSDASFNVVDFGAKPNVGGACLAHITSGNATINCERLFGPPLTAANVGNKVWLHQADTAHSIKSTTIASVIDADSFTVASTTDIQRTLPGTPSLDEDFSTGISACTARTYGTGGGSIAHDAANNQLEITNAADTDETACEIQLISSPVKGELYELTVTIPTTIPSSSDDRVYVRIGSSADRSETYLKPQMLRPGVNKFDVAVRITETALYLQLVFLQGTGTVEIDSVKFQPAGIFVGWNDTSIRNYAAFQATHDAGQEFATIKYEPGIYFDCIRDYTFDPDDVAPFVVSDQKGHYGQTIKAVGAIIHNICPDDPSDGPAGVLSLTRASNTTWYGLRFRGGNVRGILGNNSFFNTSLEGSGLVGLGNSDNNRFYGVGCDMSYSNNCWGLTGIRVNHPSGIIENHGSNNNTFIGVFCTRQFRCVSAINGSDNKIIGAQIIGGSLVMEPNNDSNIFIGNSYSDSSVSNFGWSMGEVTFVDRMDGVGGFNCANRFAGEPFEKVNNYGSMCDNITIRGRNGGGGGYGVKMTNISVRDYVTEDTARPHFRVSFGAGGGSVGHLDINCDGYYLGATGACFDIDGLDKNTGDTFYVHHSRIYGCDGQSTAGAACTGVRIRNAHNVYFTDNLVEDHSSTGMIVRRGSSEGSNINIIHNVFRRNNADNLALGRQLDIDGVGGLLSRIKVEENTFIVDGVATTRSQLHWSTIANSYMCNNDFFDGGTGTHLSTGTVDFDDLVVCDSQATYKVVPDSGDANPATLTTFIPSENLATGGFCRTQTVSVNCQDADGCNITPAESDAVCNGTTVTWCNPSTNSIDIVHSAGVSEMVGGTNQTLAALGANGIQCVQQMYVIEGGGIGRLVGTGIADAAKHWSQKILN